MNNTIPPWLHKYLEYRVEYLRKTKPFDVGSRIDEIIMIFKQEEQ